MASISRCLISACSKSGSSTAPCYQIREFGPGLKVLVDLIRDLVAKYKLFL